MIPEDQIRQAVLSGIKTVTSREITLDDTEQFADHDIDSLDRMSLMLEVEDSLGLDFGELDPKEVTSISDYFQLVWSLEGAESVEDAEKEVVA